MCWCLSDRARRIDWEIVVEGRGRTESKRCDKNVTGKTSTAPCVRRTSFGGNHKRVGRGQTETRGVYTRQWGGNERRTMSVNRTRASHMLTFTHI